MSWQNNDMLMDNYERIKRYITYKAGSEQAEDLTQQVFLQASKHMESFRNDSSLYTWLYSIATNTIINEAKRCCNRKVVLTNELPRYITTDFTGDIDFKIDLGTSIDKLDRVDQEILTLRYIADYSFRDIAKLLQINESTLKNRLYRCLGKLRHDLESWHVEAPFNPKQYMILVHLLETGQSGHELQQVTNDFMAILRQNFKRITSALNFEPLRKVTYHIYPDQKSLHAEIPNPEASKTAIGNLGGIDLIRIVSPLNPGPVYDYPFIIRSSLPLYTFSLLKQMNPRIPGWLLYGLGSYIGLNRPRTRVQNRLRLLYSQDIPSVKDLRPYGGEKFKQMAGYDLCYTMVDFIVTQYGWDALHRYIREPDNHMGIFLCSMEQLEEAWKQFVKEQYIY